jgi:RND family efflux transporter MFP subunit
MSELNFVTQGVTAEIYVKEGMKVTKGTLIASVDKRERLRELEKAEKELERAKVELVDKLIGMGYDASMKDVPQDVMKRAEVTSGYFSAQYQLQSAKKALDECNLYAHFSGRIANLEARPYQNNSKICTLIDDSQFEVEFKILEAEFKSVKKGQHVKVSPFVNDSLMFEGVVTEINPLVDDKGLIKVMARLDNNGSELMDGMNVRIIVEEEVRNMFVVPKDAVVERDGYHVVFLYKDGQAVWTYVDVLHSNINSFAITGCQRKETTIHEGEVVITSGNLNLADGTEVKIN